MVIVASYAQVIADEPLTIRAAWMARAFGVFTDSLREPHYFPDSITTAVEVVMAWDMPLVQFTASTDRPVHPDAFKALIRLKACQALSAANPAPPPSP